MKKISVALLLLAYGSTMAQVQTRLTPVKTLKQTQPVMIKTLVPAYDFSKMEICADLKPVTEYLPPRDFSAVAQPPRINSDGSISNVGVTRQPLAGETNKMWNPGESISVYLHNLNITEPAKERVKEIAREWERIANVKFNFVTSSRGARIKVFFDNDNKNWSWIGKDVLFNPLGLYTMHLGSLQMVTPGEFRRIVLHEFGHALGFIHEHQSPAVSIQWDKEKVYTFFAEAPMNMSRVDVDVNIFNKYAATNTNFSSYDRFSIMHYSIPPELTLDGMSSPRNSEFSFTDVQYAGRIYPFPINTPPASGTLRTGDDCDLVDFKVEYNVLPADQIEFVLELGDMNGKAVTWWKKIEVPLTGNRTSGLWVQNHSLIASENRKSWSVQLPFADLDTQAPIAFWKAKMLGVHTKLNFTWQVLRALKGGCRVRLVWKDDSCS